MLEGKDIHMPRNQSSLFHKSVNDILLEYVIWGKYSVYQLWVIMVVVLILNGLRKDQQEMWLGKKRWAEGKADKVFYIYLTCRPDMAFFLRVCFKGVVGI